MIVTWRGLGGIVPIALLSAYGAVSTAMNARVNSDESILNLPSSVLADIFLLTAVFLAIFAFLVEPILRRHVQKKIEEYGNSPMSESQTARLRLLKGPHGLFSLAVRYWSGIFLILASIEQFISMQIIKGIL